MQFRFRKNNTNELITFIEVKDYSEMFETLTFMKDHECEYCFEFNTEDSVESKNCVWYYIKNIALCVGPCCGEMRPHFVVDLEEE